MSDKFEKYIQDKLSEEDQRAFESQMSDEEKKQAAFELGVKQGIEENMLRSKVAEFESKRSQGWFKPAYVGIAASVILIATFSYIFFLNQPNLYGQYYTGYPNFEHTVVRGEESELLKDQAYRAYDLGQFDQSSSLFTDLINLEPTNIPAYFFKGMSLMENGQYKEAIDSFETVVKSDGDYKEAALWYSALGFIKLGNQDKARIFLDQLVDSDEYAKKAKALRKEL